MKPTKSALLSLLLLALAAAASITSLRAEPILQKWFYYSTNLLVDENIPPLESVWQRASAAGYTHVLLADSKFSRLPEMGREYFANIEEVKGIAATNNLTVIPAVFPIGYSNDLLSQDPNLAEGLPVRDALFVVNGGVGQLQADPPVTLPGGDMSDLSLWTWYDSTVVPDHGTALIRNPPTNARLNQLVTVHPYRQYHISVRIKTQNFTGYPQVEVLAGEKSLQYTNLGVLSTQDWTQHDVVFNSLDATQVGVYFGNWGAATGSLWLDDAVIEEVGLLNVLRRDGAPLTVKKTDGTVLVEGVDYDPIFDPRLGVIPYSGEYEVWHMAPTISTSLPDGTRLRVSYYHAITIYDGQVSICPSEPKTMSLLRDQARRMHEAWGASGYFMSHDEIRVLNQDFSCTERGLEAGEILAQNVSACAQILRRVNPGGKIYVWSDMFDPNHNAVADYYLVNGDLAGSWNGLRPGVTIMCWNQDTAAASLQFFSDLHLRTMIAGYYDAVPDNAQAWLTAATGIPGVWGIMYTTWLNDYSDLETFSHNVDDADYHIVPFPRDVRRDVLRHVPVVR